MISRRLFTLALATLVACGGSKPTTTTGGGGTGTGPGSGAVVGTPTGGGTPATGDDAVLPLWPKVKKGTLPNGLTYYILPHGKPENRAFMWLAVNAGSILEDDDQKGLAHFDEHMAFNGTKRFPKADIVNYLEKIGMRFGADLNAYTSFDETVYQLEVPTDKPEFVSKGLDILRDWAGNVSYDKAEVDKERGVVLEEWRLGRGAFERLRTKTSKVIYKGSRYAERDTIGDPEILKKAPRDTLYRFYKDWYRPDLMAVVIVGDVDPAKIEKEVSARFGDLPRVDKPRPRIHGEVPKADGTRVSIVTDKELPFSLVAVTNMFAHRPEATHRDFRRIVAEQLYGQIINERLASVARRPDAPFAGAQVGVQSDTREIDQFSRQAQAKGGKEEDTLRALFTEVLRVEKHGFTQTELDRARTNIARVYEQNADAEATSDSSDYTAEITRNFFEGEFMIGRAAERDLTLKALPEITVAELNKLAQSFGGAENRAIVLAGPEGKPLPDEKRILAIIAEVEKSKIDPWEDKAVSATLIAAGKEPKPGKITKEKTIEALGVTEWTLSNGVTVVLKPTDFEADAIAVSGDSPGGLAVASAKQWASARFADDIAGLGGVGELDEESLGKALAGKRVSVSASIGETTESVDGNASARDTETMFQLIYLRMTSARKDDEAFGVWKGTVAEQLTNRLRVPEVQFAIQSQDVLFKGNARRKPPTAEDVNKVNQDQALAFFKDRFGDASDFTFTIVGKFDVAKLKPLVETYLASLPAKGRKEKEKDLSIRRVGGVVKKTWNLGSEPKARVSVAFMGDEAWSRDKERDMFILSSVTSIRLREILREDMGGVYGVGAGGFLARTPHQERTFSLQFGCAPDAVDKLIKAAFDEFTAISTNGIGADYLDKVKQTYLRERETSMKTNGFWIDWLSSSYRYKEDPSIILDPSKVIARMTTENVKAAAKRYIDFKAYYQAVLMPAAGTAPAAPAAKP
ncbi:MAG: insulinase family protein [Myxococcales bacterium]|nr:insulinase family protein [Myxococcales bacterium]